MHFTYPNLQKCTEHAGESLTTTSILHAIVQSYRLQQSYVRLVTFFERESLLQNQVTVSTEAIPEIKDAKVAK